MTYEIELNNTMHNERVDGGGGGQTRTLTSQTHHMH